MRPMTLAIYALLVICTTGCATLPHGSAPGLVESDSPESVAVDYDGGFRVASEDGRNALKIGGLFQATAGAFGGERKPSTDFTLRRMRPEITARFEDAIVLALEPNFTDDGVELEEAWFGVELAGGASTLMFGRMKAPFNLEEVRSRRHIDFTRFSMLNQFAPAEDHGVFLNGKSSTGRWEYGFAIYNGTGTADTTSSKDFAARVMLHPAALHSDSPWRNLQFGLAGTWGRQEESVGGDSIHSALGFPLMRFVPDLELNGRRWRAGLELAWFHGPFFLQGEVLATSQEMATPTQTADVGFHGAYLNLSCALTGEDKTFGGVVPKRPLDSKSGSGNGAWVLALRLSELRADDDLERNGFTEAGTFTDRVRTLSLGLNWIPNTWMILRNALVYSRYSDEVLLDKGRDRDEFGVLIEAQLHF